MKYSINFQNILKCVHCKKETRPKERIFVDNVKKNDWLVNCLECYEEIKEKGYIIKPEWKRETTEQRLNRLELENQRLRNQNIFLLEQLTQIEQPPK